MMTLLRTKSVTMQQGSIVNEHHHGCLLRLPIIVIPRQEDGDQLLISGWLGR